MHAREAKVLNLAHKVVNHEAGAPLRGQVVVDHLCVCARVRAVSAVLEDD